jgi:2-polyprenyl-6-hydroxyphenyl methylase/3-demethylubiquinone-9 3-methyltransferase
MLFRRAAELLKPDGFLLVSTPYHGYAKNLALSVVDGWDKHHTVDWDGGHIKFFSVRTLRTLAVEEGFEPSFFRGVGRWPYLWKSMILGFRPRSRL